NVEFEQLAQGFHRTFAITYNCGIVVETREQEFLEHRVFAGQRRAESRETARLVPDVSDAWYACRRHDGSRILDQSGRKMVEHALGGFVEFQLLEALRVAAVDFFIKSGKQRHLGADHSDIQDLRFVAVVEVGGVVGDLVDEIDQLRFDRRTLAEQIFRERRILRRVVIARMFYDSFADFKRQINSGKIQI